MKTLGQRSETIMLWSLHKGTGWRTQYDRLERWYLRLREVQSKNDITDILFTFFQNCYYLREWLELTSHISKSELDQFFSEHIEMQICRDICNVTKHFSVSRPSQEFELSFAQEYCDPNSPYNRDCYFGGDARLLVITDNKNYDARELAYICITHWKEFLTKNGLLTK